MALNVNFNINADLPGAGQGLRLAAAMQEELERNPVARRLGAVLRVPRIKNLADSIDPPTDRR